MSYLSILKDPDLIKKKSSQLENIKKQGKVNTFRTLNLKKEPSLLQKEHQERLAHISHERAMLYMKLYEQYNSSMKINSISELVEDISVPNNNNILFVPLFDNQLGENHYAGVYLDLILEYESQGNIIPGKTNLFETSSGSGGIACSKVAKELGYSCIIGMPAGGEKARENAVKDNGAKLILTDKAKYTNGFPDFIRDFYLSPESYIKRKNKELFFLSHSQGKRIKENNTYQNNDIAIKALAKVGYQILDYFKEEGKNLDYVISGIGNGTNTLGIGGPLHLHEAKIVGFETFEGANMYDRIYPGQYEDQYGLKPGELGRHSMPGLSPSQNEIYFPHFENSVDMMDDIYLVANNNVKQKFQNHTGGKLNDENIIYFDNNQYETPKWGRTTKAGLYVGLELAKKIENKNIIIFGYDKANRYDS